MPETKINHIEYIVFDLFGVLFSEGHLVSNVLMDLLPHGSDKGQVKSAYDKYNLGLIKEAEFWPSIGVSQPTQLRDEFLGHFTLDPEYHDVIGELSPRFRLGILSNLPADWAQAFISSFDFDSRFSPCLFSGQAGCKKPRREIYWLFQQQAGTPFEQMVFIDDRLENLQSAYEQGMTTVYYQRDNENHAYRADFTIQRLGQLVNILTDL
jgi:FMN phosphatase YigB (HAD superfamily)